MLTLEAQEVENATHADGVKTRHHLRDTGVVVVLLEANRAVETLLKAKERALGYQFRRGTALSVGLVKHSLRISLNH